MREERIWPGGDGAAVRPAAPDPEVVAKPRRRQFTAEHRSRMLEETYRFSKPGEIGRLDSHRTQPARVEARSAASGSRVPPVRMQDPD